MASRIGSGHINYTFKIEGEPSFILQRINKNVFKEPEVIAHNIRLAANYLRDRHPHFIFMSNLLTMDGKEMAYDSEGYSWRLYPLIDHSFTVDQLETDEQAFEAARAFGSLCRNLDGCEVKQFKPVIPGFQDLSWRYQQFEDALTKASTERQTEALASIQSAKHFNFLVTRYEDLIRSGALKLRIVHNDTKINNILFDGITGQTICAIDLDTLMPGYFIYDLGDMVRTFVSPVSEEEKDIAKIVFRKNIYEALTKGYLSKMNEVMSAEEKQAIPFSGLMMTYIMALRFLADYLNGDVYYHTTYTGQNLVRANNQFRLLQILSENV
jgi:Ser/Thr protein kinase RdoA (MazF antagonist)